jgi:hypothetical protein
MIWYRYFGIIFILIGVFIERKIVAKKMCENYNDLFVAYKSEWQLIASQLLCELKCQLPLGIIQSEDLAYMIIEKNEQLTVHPLNNGKVMDFTKLQHQYLMRNFQHKRTVYKTIDTNIIIYHRMSEPFDNCILLIKRSGVGKLPIR